MEKQKLPNASAVLILGILSIVTCCCYGVVGLIFGIIALVLYKKDMALYRQEPERYTDYNNLNIGRICAIIGIVLSGIYILINVFLFATLGTEGIKDMQENLMEKIKYEQENN